MDALPAAAAGPRARLMTNIGLAFVQLGQYADAAGAFETAIHLSPDHQVGEAGGGERLSKEYVAQIIQGLVMLVAEQTC